MADATREINPQEIIKYAKANNMRMKTLDFGCCAVGVMAKMVGIDLEGKSIGEKELKQVGKHYGLTAKQVDSISHGFMWPFNYTKCGYADLYKDDAEYVEIGVNTYKLAKQEGLL